MLLTLSQHKGYTGSERTLTRYIGQLRQAQGLPAKRGHSTQSSTKVIDPQSPPLTARRASYLILQREVWEENREPEDTELLAHLVTQHPNLATAVTLADEFLQLLRQQRAEALEMWLMKALQSSLKPFQTFAQGLLDDYAASQSQHELQGE